MKSCAAIFLCADWVQVFERGKLPGDYLLPRDGLSTPAVDVAGMVMQAQLNDLRRRLESLCMALIRPVIDNPSNGSSASSLNRGQLLADFSGIWEFLTARTWADGKTRIPGSMSLKLASGTLQGTLTDTDSGCFLTRAGNSLDDVFLALETALSEPHPGWRKTSFQKPKK